MIEGAWALAAWITAEEPDPTLRPLTDAISFREPNRCLDGPTLASATARWLGRDVVDDRLSFEVFTHGRAIGFTVFRDGELRAERRFSPAPSECDDLRAAMGLGLALAIDASVLESLGIAPLEPSPVVAPAAKGPPPSKQEDAPNLKKEEPPPAPPPSGPRFRGAVEASGIAAVAVLPGVSFGGGLTGEFGWVDWLDLRLGALGAGAFPIDLGDGTLRAALAAGNAGLCPARRVGKRVRLRLCFEIAAGAVTARGDEFTRNIRRTLPWVAGIAGGDLRIDVSEVVALGIGADLVAPFVRTNFDVRDDEGTVVDSVSADAAGFKTGIDLVFRFGEKTRAPGRARR